VVPYLKYFTFHTQEEIAELEREVKAHPEQRAAQRALAREVTEMVHGAEHVARVERAAAVLFGGSIAAASVDDILMVFDDAPSVTMKAGALEAGIAGHRNGGDHRSCGIERRSGAAHQAGGLYVNDRRLTDERGSITMADAISGALIVLRKGQRERRIVKIER
jgi:tyrosyl-tRNA synthetase